MRHGATRRDRRRQDTIDEVLATALAVMAEEGVAALNLAEVARRMGIRPPSLYVYFDSKLALFDALFESGSTRLTAAVEAATVDTLEPLDAVRAGSAAYVRWCAENPVMAQLLFWRPVPGFTPSDQAFAPSVRLIERLREQLQRAVGDGTLDAAAMGDEALALYTSLLSGVVSQHLANEPGVAQKSSRFLGLPPVVIEMFLDRYAPAPAPSKGGQSRDRQNNARRSRTRA